MKFRKLILLFIAIVMLVCYFTKPTKQEFIEYIQPSISKSGIPPAVDFQDKFLYVKVNAMYVNALNPTKVDGRDVAPAYTEEYIGVFKKFWKMGQ